MTFSPDPNVPFTRTVPAQSGPKRSGRPKRQRGGDWRPRRSSSATPPMSHPTGFAALKTDVPGLWGKGLMSYDFQHCCPEPGLSSRPHFPHPPRKRPCMVIAGGRGVPPPGMACDSPPRRHLLENTRRLGLSSQGFCLRRPGTDRPHRNALLPGLPGGPTRSWVEAVALTREGALEPPGENHTDMCPSPFTGPGVWSGFRSSTSSQVVRVGLG